jgi:hypothetical protein
LLQIVVLVWKVGGYKIGNLGYGYADCLDVYSYACFVQGLVILGEGLVVGLVVVCYTVVFGCSKYSSPSS